MFGDLAKAIGEGVPSKTDRDELLDLLAEMRAADQPNAFGKAYAAFIGRAADYMGLVSPFLPALTALLAS